jgi:hypothetical protein
MDVSRGKNTPSMPGGAHSLLRWHPGTCFQLSFCCILFPGSTAPAWALALFFFFPLGSCDCLSCLFFFLCLVCVLVWFVDRVGCVVTAARVHAWGLMLCQALCIFGGFPPVCPRMRTLHTCVVEGMPFMSLADG